MSKKVWAATIVLGWKAVGLNRAVNSVFLAEQPGNLAPGPSGDWFAVGLGFQDLLWRRSAAGHWVPASAVLPEPWSDLGISEDEGKRCPKNWRSPKRAIVKLADFRHAKFLSLDSQYSFGYEQWLRGLCERLGGFEPDIAAVGNSADSLQVLRDVAQNVAFAGSILDVYRAKEQVILALLERDVVVDIPQRAMAVLALPYLSFTCTTASGTRAIHGSLKGGWRKSWTTCLLKERSFR